MGSEEIDETPTGVLASGGDRGRLGQRNHQLVDGASPGKGMCFCTLGGRGRQTSHRRPHLRLQKRVRDTPSRRHRALGRGRPCRSLGAISGPNFSTQRRTVS